MVTVAIDDTAQAVPGTSVLSAQQNCYFSRLRLQYCTTNNILPYDKQLNNALLALNHKIRAKSQNSMPCGYLWRCVCWIYPTYVGYSAILSDNAEVDADIRIRIAIPSLDV